MNRASVILQAETDSIVAHCSDLLKDRVTRLFFVSILGAKETPDGWECPRRRSSLASLAVRVNTFLESKGWKVKREGFADEAVAREIERKRSFQRTLESASALRDGDVQVRLPKIKAALRKFGWDEAARKLLPHQDRGLVHGLTAVNSANFSVPGSGKTATTLAIAAAHLASRTIDVVVVVGPLSCFAPWEREARIALPGRIATIRVRGSAAQRHARYAAARERQLLLISYASAAADQAALTELCRAFKVMVVVDEAHRIKRFRGGTWASALLEVAKGARVKTILTGTPMPQSGRDLYSQLNILWPAGELTGPRDDFAARVDRDFASVLRDVIPFVSRTPKEALGLAPYEVVRIDVPMSGTQAEIYDLIEGQFRRRIEGAETWKDKLDSLRRGRPIRLLQAATNPDLLNRTDGFYNLPRVTNPNPSLMERLATYRASESPAKSIRAIEIVRGIATKKQKVVCWSNFVPNLDQFSDLVRSQLGVPCFQIDGRVAAGDDAVNDDPGAPRSNPEDSDTRERIIEQFLDTAGAAVLVTNPASCSESISLHRSCHNALYLDRTYDCALYLQSIDRIHRLGLPRGAKVKIFILAATVGGRPTVDHLVSASLGRKEATMLQLLQGAEVQPFNLSLDPLDAAEGTEEDLVELLRFLLGEEE